MRSTSQNKKYAQSAPQFSAKQEHPRGILRGQALIHDDQHLFIAPMSNLSVGGLFLEQLTNIPTGRQVKIILKSERLAVTIQVQGTVVRVDRGGRRGLAVQFNELSAEAREAIENFVFESRMESALKVA